MQQQQKVQLMCKIESDFVPGRPGTKDFFPGRPGTEDFVPGFLQLPLSRVKGTPGQENFFVQGKGTTGRPVPIV